MPAATFSQKVLELRFKYAQQDIAEVKKLMASVEADSLDLAKTTQQLAKSYAQLNVEQKELNQLRSTLVQGTGDAAKAQADLNKQITETVTRRKAEVVATEEANSAADVGKQLQTGTIGNRAAVREFQQVGRIQSFALQNLALSLPGGGGQAFQAFSGAFTLLDTIPKLELSFKSLGSSIKEDVADIAGLVPRIGGFFKSVVTGASSLGVLGPIGAALAVGAVAIGVAFKNLTDEFAKENELIRAQTEARRQINDLVNQGLTSGDVAQRVTDLRTQQQQEQSVLDDLKKQREDFFNQYSGGQYGIGARLGAIFGDGSQFDTQIAESEKRIADFDAQIQQLLSAVRSGATAANDQKKAQEDLAKAQEEQAKAAEDTRQKLIALQNQAGNVQSQIFETVSNAVQQRTQLQQDRDLADARAQEDAQIKSTFALQDYLEHKQQLEDNANKQIIQARQQSVKQAADILNTQNKALAALTADSSAKYIEEQKKFHIDELKAFNDYTKQRLRSEEDLQDTLLSDQAANDVVRYLQDKAAGEKQLRRQTEDFNDQQKQRQDDLQQRLSDERAADAQRSADIIQNAQEQTTALRDQQAQRIADIQKGLEEQQAADEAARQKQLFRDEFYRQLAAQRQEQDRQIQDQRSAEALQKQLTKYQMELDAIDRTIAGVQALTAAAQTFANTARGAGGNVRPSSYTSGSSGYLTNEQIDAINARIRAGGGSSYSQTSYGPKLTAFAMGAWPGVDRPTLALLGERLPPGYREAVIPYKESEGIPARYTMGGSSSRSSTSIVFAPQYNSTIGDIASTAEVSQALQQTAEQTYRDFAEAFQIAQYRPQT